MTLIDDFRPGDRLLLLQALEAAAVLVSVASPGRKEETASEGFAMAAHVLESAPDHVAHPLIGSIIGALRDRAAGGGAFPDYGKVVAAPDAHERAEGIVRSVVGVVDAGATPDEAAAYRAWLLDIAVAVARAGKEDQGFLGRGGVLVNDAERAALGGPRGPARARGARGLSEPRPPGRPPGRRTAWIRRLPGRPVDPRPARSSLSWASGERRRDPEAPAASPPIGGHGHGELPADVPRRGRHAVQPRRGRPGPRGMERVVRAARRRGRRRGEPDVAHEGDLARTARSWTPPRRPRATRSSRPTASIGPSHSRRGAPCSRPARWSSCRRPSRRCSTAPAVEAVAGPRSPPGPVRDGAPVAWAAGRPGRGTSRPVSRPARGAEQRQRPEAAPGRVAPGFPASLGHPPNGTRRPDPQGGAVCGCRRGRIVEEE